MAAELNETETISPTEEEINLNEESSKEEILLFTKEEPLSDIALVVEGKTLFSSRSLLAFSSPVFRCMFSSEFREKDQNTIELPGKCAKVVNEMLKFLHPATDSELENGMNSAINLLPLAEEYQMKQLTKKCEETIMKTLQSDSFIAGDVLLECLLVGFRFGLETVVLLCIDKSASKGEYTKLVQTSEYVPAEIKTQVYERRIEVLEGQIKDSKTVKNTLDTLKNRLRAIIGLHEDHCRCRTELKIRPSLQRQCIYCARNWCSDHVSTDAYRNSYWFNCNHRIGYSIVNDCMIRGLIDSDKV